MPVLDPNIPAWNVAQNTMQIPFQRATFRKPNAVNALRPRHRLWRIVLFGFFAGLSIVLGYEVIRVVLLSNQHTVIPGRVYRSAQLSPTQLHELIEKEGIRTVVNLRGCCIPFDWYQSECRVTHERGVSHEDITLSANRLPPPLELRRLIEVMDRSEYPIVFHCRQGADRTSLAATMYMLLHTDAEYSVALKQCSPRYGHFPFLTTANMDLFFEMYEKWLVKSGLIHQPEHFRRWVLDEYRPDPAPALIELIDPEETLIAGEAGVVRIRVKNLSNSIWHLKNGSFTGVFVRYGITGPDGKHFGTQYAGRFEATVAPGASIEIPLALPLLTTPGNYRISVDLSDKHLSFTQLGSTLFECEIQVQKATRR